MLSTPRFGAFAGLIAAISMSSPAAAAEISVSSGSAASIYSSFDHSAYDGDFETAQRHRWRRRGWHGGWHRDRRVDAGDVIAGVLILGGIAAIANAAKQDRDYRYRDRDYRNRDYRYRDRDYRYRDYRDRDEPYRDDRYRDRDYRDRGGYRYDDHRGENAERGSGLDNAAAQCVDRIGRDRRVGTVEGVSRTRDGWVVVGDLASGGAFTCRIGNDGRIVDIDYDGVSGASLSPADGNQWSGDQYRDARRSVGVQSPTAETEPRPAYPGGPVPGEDYSAEIDNDIGG